MQFQLSIAHCILLIEMTTLGEVKTLLRQLLSAVAHLHENWMLHRDIKTSNLLLGHDGILRVSCMGQTVIFWFIEVCNISLIS